METNTNNEIKCETGCPCKYEYFHGFCWLKGSLNEFKHEVNLATGSNKSNYPYNSNAVPLDPNTIPKFENQLVKPPAYEPTDIMDPCTGEVKARGYIVDMSEFKEQILPPGFPMTTVWGYGGLVRDPMTGEKVYFRNAPGPTFEARRYLPTIVQWINRLNGPHLFAVDPTLHWANPNRMPLMPDKPWPPFPPGFSQAQMPVPLVTHLHGGEVASTFDGGPDEWFTSNCVVGPSYATSLYEYPNQQLSATLWYHDHALGITRLNVYSGFSGFYLLRDPLNRIENPDSKDALPFGEFEVPLAIQDRSFNTDGSLQFINVGDDPEIHPYWYPEFFGDCIMVNGKVWPNLNVKRQQYRFRILNGSNARFYNMTFSNHMNFVQIGSDGGFLPSPVTLANLFLAPGERADVLVDFSETAEGQKIILQNDANTPFPIGTAPDPNTTGQIMQFTVQHGVPKSSNILPSVLNTIPDLIPNAPNRILTLVEIDVDNVPEILLLNGQKWSAPVSELPRVGSTEEWVIANLTPDAHPIHLHLVQFLLYNRQDFNATDYMNAWISANGGTMPPFVNPTVDVPVEPYLVGDPIDPPDNEKGWKDTIKMYPNQVTRIRVRFAPQNTPVLYAAPGINLYPFDPCCGQGYAWHCHILDHEDNEMMRPYKVIP